MSSIAKANISLSKKDLAKTRVPLMGSRNVVFYHKANFGEKSINLLDLTMPNEMPTQAQATMEEINGAQLFINKKNLDLVSSVKGQLIQGLDYIVTSSYSISLIGGAYQAYGTEHEEIFIGTINSAPISDLVVASAKSVIKTYELAVGETILNLGKEYKVGENIHDNVGSIKVFVNGVLAQRSIDYNEVNAGTGSGTTIEFLQAPTTLSNKITVDFGVMSVTDHNAIGTIESLSGAVKKIADDLSQVAGTAATDYLNSNPSEIERRAFGDMVLAADKMREDYEAHKQDYADHKTIPHIIESFSSGFSWYRKWSDGWIEQGGRVGPGSSATVTLHIAHVDTEYTIHIQKARYGQVGSEWNPSIHTVWADAFYFENRGINTNLSNADHYFYWTTKGRWE